MNGKKRTKKLKTRIIPIDDSIALEVREDTLRQLGVGKHQMDSITLMLTYVESEVESKGRFHIHSVLEAKPISAYPRWLKNRIKFRMRRHLEPFARSAA